MNPRRTSFLIVILIALGASPVPLKSQDNFSTEEMKKVFEESCKLLTDKKYDEAIAGFRKIYDKKPETETGATSAYNLACAYSLLDKKEDALNWLEKAIAGGFLDVEHIKQDTDLTNVRGEERYRKCLEKIASARVATTADAVAVPFCDPSAATGVPYIKATINDGTGVLLIDTGISGPPGNILCPNFAPKCNLSKNSGTLKFNGGEGKSMELKNQLFATIKFGGADGVLGFWLFETVKTTIDYPGKRVIFEQYKEDDPAGKDEAKEGEYIIPFRYLPIKAGGSSGQFSKSPFAEATINGKKTLVLIDTGTNWSFVSPSGVEALGLTVQQEKVLSKMYDAAHIDIDIGNLSLKDIVFVKLAHPTLASISQLTGEKIHAIIGNNILGKYLTTLDYRKKRIILTLPKVKNEAGK